MRNREQGQLEAMKYQKYFKGEQYEGLAPWWKERDGNGAYVPVRRRAPGVRYNLCKTICNRMVGFLMGANTFPELKAEGLGETLKRLRNGVLLKVVPPAFRKACIQGAVGVTFGFRRGKLLVRSYGRSQAWPVFDDADELMALVCEFEGKNPKTGKGAHFRMVLDAMEEVWYVSETKTGSDEREWKEHDRAVHGFGFVPAVWVRHMSEEPGEADGESLLAEVLSLQDEINYCVSRESRALNFTADPQTVVQDESPEVAMERLTKSPGSTWFLGKDGKVGFLEINGKGIELQGEFTGDLRRYAMELSRVVLPDQERVSGQMSGFMLRLLYEPTIDLADELQPAWTTALAELSAKILLGARSLMAAGGAVYLPERDEILASVPQLTVGTERRTVHVGALGEERTFVLPVFTGAALDVQAFWGPYFDTSPEEEGRIVESAVRAHGGPVSSLQTAVEFVAPYLGVRDVEEEVRRIEVERAVDGLAGG